MTKPVVSRFISQDLSQASHDLQSNLLQKLRPGIADVNVGDDDRILIYYND